MGVVVLFRVAVQELRHYSKLQQVATNCENLISQKVRSGLLRYFENRVILT
jgi:hypothetical protein